MAYNQYTRKYNKYYFLKDYVVGIVNNTDCEFYIDHEDYSKICQYTWCENSKGYIYASINGKRVFLHRFIMNVQNASVLIDHKNHITIDNRKSNLRIVTNSQNQMNRGKTQANTSGVKGVFWHKNKHKWQANIQINNKLLYLGIFNDKNDAIQARKEAERKYFGVYNFDT